MFFFMKDAIRKDFLGEGKEKGYSEAQLQDILSLIYEGVNRATIKANADNHSLVAYRMAYLKTHYGKEFRNVI